VTVDLVSSEEAPPETVKPPDLPKPKPQAETPPPLLIPPRPTTVTQSTISNETVPASQQAQQKQQQQQAQQRQQPQQPQQPQQQQQQQQQQPQQPQQQRTAAAPPEPATQPQRNAAAPPNPGPPPPAQLDAPTSIFDPAAIPKLLELTPTAQAAAPAPGFDALADVAAALSRQEVTAFKAHLKKCLKLPEGVDAARELKVVMRVFLRPDGALAAEPMLVAAPAAREGPAMVKAATQAFKACQPYALPAEKYNDWKVLDISLSPRDMAGG
jgi:DNA primase